LTPPTRDRLFAASAAQTKAAQSYRKFNLSEAGCAREKQPAACTRHRSAYSVRLVREVSLLFIVLILLIVGFGYSGYRIGPGWGYYGGGGISLILAIVLVLLLLKVI